MSPLLRKFSPTVSPIDGSKCSNFEGGLTLSSTQDYPHLNTPLLEDEGGKRDNSGRADMQERIILSEEQKRNNGDSELIFFTHQH